MVPFCFSPSSRRQGKKEIIRSLNPGKTLQQGIFSPVKITRR